jgi:hypothetical protein
VIGIPGGEAENSCRLEEIAGRLIVTAGAMTGADRIGIKPTS